MKIAYTRPDGGVSVVVSGPMLDGETDADFRVRVYAQSIPADATNVSELTEVQELPDREFRDAWVMTDGVPEINLPKARVIMAKRIETARQEAMRDILLREALGEDVAAEKARVAGVNSADIVAGAKNHRELKMPDVLRKGK